MHVGMEKVVAEHLGVEHADAHLGQSLQVHAGIAQTLYVADRDA